MSRRANAAPPIYSHRRRPSPAACLIGAFYDHCSSGSLSSALETLAALAGKGVRLGAGALSFYLRRCVEAGSLRHARWAHLHLKTSGRKRPGAYLSNQLMLSYLKCGSLRHARGMFDEMREKNVYSWNTMIDGYAKFGKLRDACNMFDEMPGRNVVSWNTMIVGMAKNGMCSEAVVLYMYMRQLGLEFSQYTFAGVLIACGKIGELGLVRQVHGQVLVGGYLLNVVLASSILDGYAKCGEIADARRLFDELRVRDVTCWTCMLSGYAKSGDLETASKLFEAMPAKNSVSWTTLISGLVEYGRVARALELFAKMIELGFKPDQFTFSTVLCACAALGFLRHGKQIHAALIRTDFVPNAMVWSCLVDMYAKCGGLETAGHVFDLSTGKYSLVLWNTMLSAFVQHGQGRDAIELYYEMLRGEVRPNDITFTVVLQACTNSDLVEEAMEIFDSMGTFEVTPSKEHYACLIDVLGRNGLLEEISAILLSMHPQSYVSLWHTFHEWCRLHENAQLEYEAAKMLLELESSSVSSDLGKFAEEELLLNYPTSGVRQRMNEGETKLTEISWVEVEKKVHSFIAYDREHPMTLEICEILGNLAGTGVGG